MDRRADGCSMISIAKGDIECVHVGIGKIPVES